MERMKAVVYDKKGFPDKLIYCEDLLCSKIKEK